MSRRRSWREDESGAAALETALVLPVLLVFIFAIMAFGLRVLAESYVTQKARATVRYATIVYSAPAGATGAALNPQVSPTSTQYSGVYPKQPLLLSFAQAQFKNNALATVTDVQFAANSAPCLSSYPSTSGAGVTTTAKGPQHGEPVMLVVTAQVRVLGDVPLIPAFLKGKLANITTTVQAVCE